MKRRDLRERIDVAGRIKFPRTALDALEGASLFLDLARGRIERRLAEGNPETPEEELDERLRCEELAIRISVLQIARFDADAQIEVLDALNHTLENVRKLRALVHRSIERRDAARAELN